MIESNGKLVKHLRSPHWGKTRRPAFASEAERSGT